MASQIKTKIFLELQKNIEKDVCLCLVGNKIDLQPSRCVSAVEAARFALDSGAAYFETSAKTNEGKFLLYNFIHP